MNSRQKVILMFLFLIMSLYGFSQTTDSTKRRFQIGVTFSPDLCGVALHGDGSALSNQIISAYKGIDHTKFGYTNGFSICYALNHIFAIEMDLQHSIKGFSDITPHLVFGPVPGTAKQPTAATFIYNYHYIDIPLKVNVMLGKKRLRFIGSAGFSANIFLTDRTVSKITYSDGSKTKTGSWGNHADAGAVNLSPLVSAGIDYRINSKTHIRIMPNGSYALFNLYGSQTPVTNHLWSAGVMLGVYMTL